MKHHVASFSTGLSSALATERVINRYGRDDVEIVFEDTVFEDDDNYRFMKQCEARWQVPITVLCEGRNPYQVAKDSGKRYCRQRGFCRCGRVAVGDCARADCR